MCTDLAVDSRESTGAPEKEIEITSAMIKAGVEAYRPFWGAIRDCDDGAPEEMVGEIFKAMLPHARFG